MENISQVPAPILPRKVPVQARSRERFERILEVAVELIVEKGIDAVAMSDIAKSAKISIASLYQYFPDKAAIIATLAERYNADGRACVSEVFAKVEKPTDLILAMHRMIDDYFEFFCSVPGVQAVWQASQSDKRLQELDAEDMEYHAKTIDLAIQRVMPGMSAEESLRLGRLFTIIIGTAVRTAICMSGKEARAFIDACKFINLTPGVEKVIQTESGKIPS